MRKASSFDSYAGLLETVKSRVKEGLGEKKKQIKNVQIVVPQEDEEDASSDDLGWEFSDAEDVEYDSDSPVSPLPFRQDLDPEIEIAYEIIGKRSKTVTAMLLQDDESQEQMEDVFHGELKKADMFIDLHERYFANRSEIIRAGAEGPSDSQLIQDILIEAGVEGMSVHDLEAMLPSKKKYADVKGSGKDINEKKEKEYEISKGSKGFERFIPTAVPSFFKSNNY
ncbi:UNVERIFIED_CONTAM: hypothetical protein HDU68_007921 [Siphonaria sp. JEL0065]|nr:hypothetical protein HDU68_007921 [Siphonaria sp. JEL0065]